MKTHTADRHGRRSLEEIGENNICFEAGYRHTDTTWPLSENDLHRDAVRRRTDKQAYKVLCTKAIKMLELDQV